MEMFPKNIFLPERLAWLEAEPALRGVMTSVEGRNASEIMQNFMVKLIEESGASDLDNETRSFLNGIKNRLAMLYAEEQAEVSEALADSSSAKDDLIRELMPYVRGRNIETVAELAVLIENASIIIQARKFGTGFENILVQESDTIDDPRERNYEREGRRNATDIIRSAAEQKWASNLVNEDVQKLLKTTQGFRFLAKKKIEFDDAIWHLIEEKSSGFLGLGWIDTTITFDRARDIAREIRRFPELNRDDEFQRLFTSLDLSGLSEDEQIQKIRRAGKKAEWKNFATRLKTGNVGWKETAMAEAEAREAAGEADASLMESVSISRTQNEIVGNLGMVDPMFCVIGNAIFVHGKNGDWKTATLQDMENADAKEFDVNQIFVSSHKEAYLEALKNAEGLDVNTVEDIGAILENQQELVRRIGERITVQKDFGPFDRAMLMRWRAGTAPDQNIQNELSTAVGNDFMNLVRDYRLNFIDKKIIDDAKKAKAEAIINTFKGMDFPNIIDGIDEECRNISQAASPPAEYAPYEKFKIAVFPEGIRVVPDGMKQEHASLFRGATLDSLKAEARRRIELENHPLAKIPLIGPLLMMFLKDAGPETMSMINSFVGFFGIKTEVKNKEEVERKIEESASEQLQAIERAGYYTTHFPRISAEELEQQAKAETGINSQREGVNSVMLEDDTKRFTGTIYIPRESTLRSVAHVDAKIQLIDATAAAISAGVAAIKNPESEIPTQMRENFYAPKEKGMLIRVEDTVFRKNSHFPVGMRVVDGGFESSV